MREQLTNREFEIYMLVVERAWDRESIAKELGLSSWTVSRATSRICRKMGVATPVSLLVQYHTRENCRG